VRSSSTTIIFNLISIYVIYYLLQHGFSLVLLLRYEKRKIGEQKNSNGQNETEQFRNKFFM